jgi:hypothetical protein
MRTLFDAVIDKIISTRTDSYFKKDGVVHLSGRGPDGRTECGIPLEHAELYGLHPDDPSVVTCEACLANAPPLLTKADLLRFHAEHGPISKRLARIALGSEWPPTWDTIPPGQFIFAEEPDAGKA